MRLVATPLGTLPPLTPARTGGLAAGVLDAVVAAPGARAAAARLLEPGALAVTTGQQPALFTGPLYTVHKALTAVALARALERRWGRPVVPVFWSAGDDHDWAEANHASWLAADGTVRTVTLRERPADAPLTPLAREPVGPEVAALLERFRADMGPGEWALAAAGWLERHFTPEATLGSAAAAALAELLAPHGLVVVDAAHPAVKRAAAPLLGRALRESAALEEALVVRDAALRTGGHEAGVAVGDGATLVLVEGRLGRDRLLRDGDGFVTRRGRERFSAAEAEAALAEAPERWSANVLLRPVVESALLPTVAYGAGPGELRYLALAEALYAPLGVPRQRPVPRWSGLVIEPRVDRALEKFGLALDDLLAPPGALEARLARGALSDAAAGALARGRAEAGEAFATLVREAVAIDPTLERPLAGLARQAAGAYDDAERKLVQGLKRRQEGDLQQVARARAAVRPDGQPQERWVGIAGLLARSGPALLPALLAAVEAWVAAGLEDAGTGS